MCVIGIDPGLARVGWAIVSDDSQHPELVDYGCINTSNKQKEIDRLKNVSEEIHKLNVKYKPTLAAIEKLYFSNNAKTAMMVGQARGVIMLTIANDNIPIYAYTPLEIKNTITGYGQATKYQIQQMVKNILKMKEAPLSDDAADAIAVALTHLFSKFKNSMMA